MGRSGVRRLKVEEGKKLYLETFSLLYTSVKKQAYVLILFDKLVFIFMKYRLFARYEDSGSNILFVLINNLYFIYSILSKIELKMAVMLYSTLFV